MTKRKAGSVFLGAVVILMSASPTRASDLGSDNVANDGRLRGGVSVTDTNPSADEQPQPAVGPGASDGLDASVELESNEPPIMGSDLFCDDGTKCRSMSWQTMRDGTLKIQRMGKGPQFEEHNQSAWHYMQVACNMEKHAVIAKNDGDSERQNLWHERARKQFANAKAELIEHLKLIQSGQVRVSPFYTLANLSLCCAAIGETHESLAYYDQYLKCRERFWTVPYGNFKLATVLLNDAKGDVELDAAKQLLLRTVGTDPTFSWNKVNDDPEYRVISWRLISEIEQRLGNVEGSKTAQKRAQALLQEIGNRRTQNVNETCKVFIEKKLEHIHKFGYP